MADGSVTIWFVPSNFTAVSPATGPTVHCGSRTVLLPSVIVLLTSATVRKMKLKSRATLRWPLLV